MNTQAPISYDFFAPQRIVFGWGRRREVGKLAAGLGRRAFLICGAPALFESGVIEEVIFLLGEAGVQANFLETITHEPEVADVDRLTNTVRRQDAGVGDLVVAVGGGSAVDLAKAVAAMATNRQSATVKDYLENVGRNLKLTVTPLPILAMPTTAGTGAEATRNAVISSYNPPFKKSLRSEMILPRIALVDPELTVSVPPSVTAASGMDAITQLIESYLSCKAQPIPQALALQGLKLAVPSLVEAVTHGASRPARERMAHAALLSGLALANSGLGLAHGVAAALGVHCHLPHGVACAMMLPVALRVNRSVREQEMTHLAHMLLGTPLDKPISAVDALIEHIIGLCDQVDIPRRLSILGVRPDQIPQIVKSSRGSSMSGNPCELNDEELTGILKEIL